MNFTYCCPVCENGIEFDCSPAIPAKISGPPESCYPSEGGDCDGPEKCDQCGLEMDTDVVMEAFYDHIADSQHDEGPDPDDQRDRDLEMERTEEG